MVIGDTVYNQHLFFVHLKQSVPIWKWKRNNTVKNLNWLPVLGEGVQNLQKSQIIIGFHSGKWVKFIQLRINLQYFDLVKRPCNRRGKNWDMCLQLKWSRMWSTEREVPHLVSGHQSYQCFQYQEYQWLLNLKRMLIAPNSSQSWRFSFVTFFCPLLTIALILCKLVNYYSNTHILWLTLNIRQHTYFYIFLIWGSI